MNHVSTERSKVSKAERPLLEPVKIFDNVYAVGRTETTVYAITTSAGIIPIDSGYPNQAESVIVPGLMKVGLEHDDAPVLLKFTIGEFRTLLSPFRDVRIVAERFPVKSRLHGGWKGAVFNRVFVGTFNVLPRALVGRFGWHLLGFCRK